jgi:hypothetical protein
MPVTSEEILEDFTRRYAGLDGVLLVEGGEVDGRVALSVRVTIGFDPTQLPAAFRGHQVMLLDEDGVAHFARGPAV